VIVEGGGGFAIGNEPKSRRERRDEYPKEEFPCFLGNASRGGGKGAFGKRTKSFFGERKKKAEPAPLEKRPFAVGQTGQKKREVRCRRRGSCCRKEGTRP